MWKIQKKARKEKGKLSSFRENIKVRKMKI